MAKKETKELTVQDENALIPFDNAPSYLQGEASQGMEALSGEDFKLPRIKMLQPLNPEIRTFPGKAIPGEFWHTIASRSLGSEFNFVPCIVSKRVILWHPNRDIGMLAFSRDGVHWDSGANQRFEIKVKDNPKVWTWFTGKDVPSSNLLEWGTFNPDDPESGPAATLSYEYLCYLPDYPELSPVVMGVSKTGLGNGKQFNTSLLSLRPNPIQSVLVRCFAHEKHEGSNIWHLPKFELKGFVQKPLYETVKKIAEKNINYNTTYEPESNEPIVAESSEY